MDQQTFDLLVALHLNNPRQGPGSDGAFRQALELSGIDTKAPLHIADIGSGTGASAIALAQATNGSITAVDFSSVFLKKLEERAVSSGVQGRITPLEADMADLPFEKGQFDVIWSEGAIYNMGFERGITAWRHFLKPGGLLIVTEITWLTLDIPDELLTFWEKAYPEIGHASSKIAQLENNGYTPLGYFALSPDCWLDAYYGPLQDGFASFLEEHNHSDSAKALVKAEEEEIRFYEKYQAYYSYGCYIARKV